MLRAQIDNDRDSVGGSGIPEVTFRPLPFAEHRTFAKRSHVKDRKGFDMTYFGSTRVVDQASAHSLPRVFTVAGRYVEIVLDQYDGLGVGEVAIGQFFQDVSVVHGGMAIGDLDVAPAFERCKHHSCAAS